MDPPARRSIGWRLVAAVMLGVGTILQVKPRADDHWSTSPRVEVGIDAEAEAAGDPPLTSPLPPRGRPGSQGRRPRRRRSLWRRLRRPRR